MGSHKKHKYYKKKAKKHRKQKINLKEVHEKLKADKKYSNLLSTLSIKDKRTSVEKRSRSESSDASCVSTRDGGGGGGDRRKIKYKYKKSRSSSMTSSSSSSTSSPASSSSSSPSTSSSDEKSRKAKHRKKKLKKEEKKKKIELLNRKHEESKKAKIDDGCAAGKKNKDDFSYDKKRMKKMKLSNDQPGPLLPDCLLQKSKAMAPMSKEEWERKQNEIRRVYDQETGRYRLIKGDGEVLEEIVSRSRHKEINKQATAGDGHFFQSTIASQIRK